MSQPADRNGSDRHSNGEVNQAAPPAAAAAAVRIKKEVVSEDHPPKQQQQCPASMPCTAAAAAATTISSSSRRNSVTTTTAGHFGTDTHPSHRPPTKGGQQVITSYFGKENSSGGAKDEEKPPKADEGKTPPIDLESVRGIFGWTTLEGVHLPFILRQTDKFTAVRIIERSLLRKYLQALPPDVYSCTYIKSYFITESEAKLLNEINMKHCDRQYGPEHFTTKDLVVQMSDVVQLYRFLSTCYLKLAHSSSSSAGQKLDDPCGIVRIDGTPIPYVVRDGTKLVPLSLFDLHVQSLEGKAETLEPWEISYMRFCCRVASIDGGFLKENESCAVALDEVKQLASKAVKFDEWWPSFRENVLSAVHRSSSSNGGGGNSAGLNLTCPKRRSEDIVSHVGSKKSLLFDGNGVPTCAVPASGYCEEILSPRYAHSNSTAKSKRSPAAHQQSSSSSALLPNHVSQPFMFDKQLSGSLVSSSSAERFFSAGTTSPYQALSAHCPRGATQCSPNGNSQHNGTASYIRSLRQMMSASKCGQSFNWQLPLHAQQHCQSSEAHQISPRCAPVTNKHGQKGIREQDRNGYSHWPLDVSNDSNESWRNHCLKSTLLSNCNHLLPVISNVLSLAADSSLAYNRSVSNALPVSSCGLGPISPRCFASPASQSLTRTEMLSGGQSTSHQHVVAPGSSQILAAKMSSPKPANPVPTNVSSDHSSLHHAAEIQTMARALEATANALALADARRIASSGSSSSSSSKLQELLRGVESADAQRNAVKTSSTDNGYPTGTSCYAVQDVVIAGMKFHGINSVANKFGAALMIPVIEIERNVKPRASAQLCEHILTKVLRVNVYECCRAQNEVLRKYLRVNPNRLTTSRFSLIGADDLTRLLPQLMYTLSRLVDGRETGTKAVRHEAGVST